MLCNLCNNDKFLPMGTRQGVRCSQCNSVERTRLLGLYLQKIGINPDQKIMHIAPEQGLYEFISYIVPEKQYLTFDFEPDKYKFARNCTKIDLCELTSFETNSFDFIIHSHVLEHTMCNIAYTLFHIHRILKPNGHHLCCIPFLAGKYDESYQDLKDHEKTQRFGQHDHCRKFGRDDLERSLKCLIKLPVEFDARVFFGAEILKKYNIPESEWTGFHGSTILHLRKSDYLLT